MKKIILTIAFIATGLVASAQVGVGTTNPETSLEVVGANANVNTKAPGALDTTDGITVPVVTNDMTITVANGTPAGTRVSQMVYSNFAGKAGYYFWDGTKWNSMVPTVTAATRTVKIIDTPTYTVSPTDDILRYITSANGVLTLPTGTPLGKEYLIVNNAGNGSSTLYLATTGTTTSMYLPGNTATTIVHIGGDIFVAQFSY